MLFRSRFGSDEVAEAARFLRWLLDENFVFLGYREYGLVDLPEGPAFQAVEGSALGILRKPGGSAYEEPVPVGAVHPRVRTRLEGGELLAYSKTNRVSAVHRRARMDRVDVLRVSPEGAVLGEVSLLGLFKIGRAHV